METFDSAALLERYAQAKNRHDVDAMRALTHEECRYEEIGTGRTLTGKQELERYHRKLFTALPDYHADLGSAGSVSGLAGSDDTAVAWGSFTGTLSGPLFGRGTAGDRIQIPAAFICQFRDGLLYRERVHLDLVALSRQAPRRQDAASAFLAAFTQVWKEPTGQRLAALFTDDAAIQHPGMDAPVHGRPAIEAYFERLVQRLPDARLQPLATSASRDRVFIHWQMQASIDGDLSCWEGIDRFDLRGDRAVHGLACFDPAQIGAPIAERSVERTSQP